MTSEELINLAQEIKDNLKALLSSDISVGFISQQGGIVYLDDRLKEFEEFISSFCSENFKLLNVYDHSLPLSGTKLGFFKTSPTTITVLFSDGEGPVGQLLVFKTRIDLFAEKIDNLTSKARPIEPPTTTQAVDSIPPSAQRIPMMKEKYKKKKYTMVEAAVIHLIDGKKTIADICKISELPLLKVEEIIRKYEKKKYIQLKRVISDIEASMKKVETTPSTSIPFLESSKLDMKKEKEKTLVVTSTPTSPKVEKEDVSQEKELSVDLDFESNDIFPIFDIIKQKVSKDEQYYLELCDGRHTIDDITEITRIDKRNLLKIFKKYQKKDGLKLLRLLGSEKIKIEPPVSTEIQEEKKEEISLPSIESKPLTSESAADETMGMLQSLSSDLSELDVGIEKLEIEDTTSIELPKAEDEIEIKDTEEEIKIPAPVKESVSRGEEESVEKIDLGEEQIEDTLEELSTLVDLPGEESKSMVFEDALSELDKLIDEATEVVSDIESKREDLGIPKVEPSQAPEEQYTSQEQYLPSEEYTSSEQYTPPSITHDDTPIEPILKNQVTCQACGTVYSASKRLCPSCHTPAKICPNCGQPVTVYSKICPYCTNLIP
ncbi:MAG: zinc ribbon domain-containing protein [Candidatus Helarchaeota archaeon]